jgi:hypothetical protein
MSSDEVNAALKNRPFDPTVDNMSDDEVNAALKNRPFDPTVDNMSDDEVNAAFNASLGRIKEMAGLDEGDVAPKPINPFPVGQDALTPQQKLNPLNNPNKGIVQGIKDFVMNPLKPNMEEEMGSDGSEMKTDPVTGRVSATFPAPKKPEAPDQSKLPLSINAPADRVGGPRDITIKFGKDGESETNEGIEEAKPDYIDLDRDGNKKESMKQAAKDAEHNEIKESLLNMNQLWKPYRG